MKSLTLLLLPIIASVIGYSLQPEPFRAPAEMLDAEITPIAVVELFTSQGCSSCPPADRQLALLQQAAAEKGQEFYGLSFHVDYWNYLGWKDPYSDEAYSQRQYQYGDWLQSRIYTPQMVVNGQTEFIGSRSREATAAVAEALSKAPVYSIDVTAKAATSTLELDYTLSQAPKGENIVAALVEKQVNTAVKRGENHGKQLTHVNVVRVFKQEVAKRETGTIQLSLSEVTTATDLKNFEAIVFIQDTETGAIKGASRVNW